jgi:transcriptional regulator with XRE-family HTH domain
MSEIQKNNISRLLKESGKSKRDLANFLQIHENGMNRILANSNIRLKRLEQIAEFLNIDVSVLIKLVCSSKSKTVSTETESDATENTNDLIYEEPDNNKVSDSERNGKLFLKLSEAIKGQRQIKDMIKKNEENLTEIANLLVKSTNK